jgi:hypothetical protein
MFTAVRTSKSHVPKRFLEYSNIYPTTCNVRQIIISGNCSTCFEWYFHPSSGAHTTVSTASGVCHTVTATCRYRGRVGIGFSVPWEAYGTCRAVSRYNKLCNVPSCLIYIGKFLRCTGPINVKHF